MKDHYTLLKDFLEKHFPAQLPKLEAIKDNDVEVIMMYNMYKRSAKNALKERVVSNINESKHIVKHSKSNNTHQVWLGDEIVTDFATKEKADAEAKRLNTLQNINEVKEMTFGAYLDDLDNRFVDLMKAAKGLNAEGSREIDMRATINQNFTLFRNYISTLKKEYSNELNKELTFSINETKESQETWPKELTSRYSDEYRFELQKVEPTYKNKPGKAKYHVIDIENGELRGTPVFGSIKSLEAFADDLIKPQGGTQSTNLGEDLNDPIMVRMRAAQAAKEKKAAKPTINPDYAAVKNAKKITFLKKERAQLMRDMEQEAEPEGGPIADEYGRKLDKIDAAIAKLSGRKEMTYDQAVGKVNEQMDIYDDIANEEFGMDYDQLGSNEQQWVHDEIDNMPKLNEGDGGSLFDYFQKRGYGITERRPDGYPAKEGVKGYIVSRGNDRYPQAVVFQHNKDTDEFTISRMSGYRIDQKDAMKAGMREKGRSGAAGRDSYTTDGNYTPVSISAKGLKGIVDHVMSGLDRESEAQGAFYAKRGRTSGTIDEAKATCCHRCGRVHVKGSGCKRPYLKGKDSCAINEIETLKEFFNK